MVKYDLSYFNRFQDFIRFGRFCFREEWCVISMGDVHVAYISRQPTVSKGLCPIVGGVKKHRFGLLSCLTAAFVSAFKRMRK